MSSGNTPPSNPPVLPPSTALSGQQGTTTNAGGATPTRGTTGSVTGSKVTLSGSGNSTGAGRSNSTTSTSGNITIPECLIADPSWPSELVLDLEKGNWVEWNWHLSLLAVQLLVSGYLNGTFTCPDPVTHPTASQIWEGNNSSLCTFMLEWMTMGEYEFASVYNTSHTVLEALRV